MSVLDEYASKYKTARMERRDGVLQVPWRESLALFEKAEGPATP